MVTIQIQIDENMKVAADNLFGSFGLDTQTAVKMFLAVAIENDDVPFLNRSRTPNAETLEAIEDVRQRRNLSGSYNSAKEAITAMLED
ncbi:MAG: type II toxin-antitoxin system RelB/DinJ family antitoxin [Planctomycetaceae bacterium]|jgi:DNA-damage-inducible protein J|nr:type II toxin-antitoxin system RelB/DinJ family antitoxin [Planctomycetaceae bacterium]